MSNVDSIIEAISNSDGNSELRRSEIVCYFRKLEKAGILEL